jgi:aryl-alcohol dehydrogenase-like predicted oxidoreductase
MERRILGKTGLEVSCLGFGGAPIGFLKTDQEMVASIVRFMLEHGLNLIDTAAMYAGSEEAIGQALGANRGEFVLVTKCGSGWESPADSDWSEEGIARFIDRSLKRLQTDMIDVVLLHSCDLATLSQGEALGALATARLAGKIRFAGYSGDNEAAVYAAKQPDVAVIEMSINVADQANIEGVLPLARHNHVGVLAKRPVANAAWKPLSQQRGLYADYARTYHERLLAMNVTPADLGLSGPPESGWPELALRFTLGQAGVTSAIVGTTDPSHLQANIEAASHGPLSQEAVAALREAFHRAESESGSHWEALT